MNPERLNIKDLTIEEPEKQAERLFDSERDITAEDWKEIKEELERGRDNADPYDFFQQAAEMKILNPDIEIEVSEEEKERMIEKMNEWWKQYGDDLGTFRRATFLKILCPEVKINLPKEAWDDVKKTLENSRGTDPGNFLWAASVIKILDPSFVVDIDSETKNDIEESLKMRKEKSLGEFAKTAKNLKIIGSDIESGLDEKTWEGLKNELDVYRQEDYYDHHENPYKWRSFCSLAANMKILAAEKVEVTDEGLQIDMSREKGLESESSALPEKRNF